SLPDEYRLASGYEVVLVAERFPSVQSEMRERQFVRVVIEAHAAQIGNPVILAMNAEAMQVFPAPVKGNLNVSMELSEGDLTGNQQAPPDHRADPRRHEAQLVNHG